MKFFRNGLLICFIFLFSMVFASNIFSQILQISPEGGLYFGHIPDEKVAIRNILLYNLDFNALNITSIRIEGQDASYFSIVQNPGAVTLQLLQKLVLEIEFQPGAERDFSAQVVIESNASTSPDKVDLSGMGTEVHNGLITFERIFGRPHNDGASSVRLTNDGGFILAGGTVLLDAEYNDATLIKLDSYGQIEWNNVYGDEDWSEGFSEAIQTLDGGFIAVGSKANSGRLEPPDGWIVKTDASGTVLWEKTFGSEEHDRASCVIMTDDGGYLVSGSYQYDTTERQDEDAYLMKLSANGETQWEKKYGGSGGEKAGTVKKTADGGYAFVGFTDSYGAGGFDAYLVKVDANGNELWHKTYGGSDWDIAGTMTLTNDGGYLLAGWTADFGAQARDVYLIKTDAEGNEQWHKIYGGVHKDGASEVIATQDGGYLVVGGYENTFFSQAWRSDGYIIKIDDAGNEIWSKTYGDYNDDGFSAVREVGDGGYIISGSTSSYGNSSEVFLLKINKWGGFTSVNLIENTRPTEFQLEQNYPNPFNNETVIRYQLPKNSHVTLNIYNMTGQKVRTLIDAFQTSGMHSVHLDAKDLASGLYLYKITTDRFVKTKKMLLLK
ncbi:MAG: T9SS type A sorting domain-containing protein [Calditrichaeota bacterium]|nr:T9SS type A sorting domain-containing protein [Calditrichota bacterium]